MGPVLVHGLHVYQRILTRKDGDSPIRQIVSATSLEMMNCINIKLTKQNVSIQAPDCMFKRVTRSTTQYWSNNSKKDKCTDLDTRPGLKSVNNIQFF